MAASSSSLHTVTLSPSSSSSAEGRRCGSGGIKVLPSPVALSALTLKGCGQRAESRDGLVDHVLGKRRAASFNARAAHHSHRDALSARTRSGSYVSGQLWGARALDKRTKTILKLTSEGTVQSLPSLFVPPIRTLTGGTQLAMAAAACRTRSPPSCHCKPCPTRWSCHPQIFRFFAA